MAKARWRRDYRPQDVEHITPEWAAVLDDLDRSLRAQDKAYEEQHANVGLSDRVESYAERPPKRKR